MPQEPSSIKQPNNCWDIFWSFTCMAMQAFGGSTAIAQQFLVDQKQGLTMPRFLEMLTVSQVLPGPNIMILSVMLGDRYFGWRGALAAFLGMITFPATLMLTVFVIYEQYASNPVVSAALAGMAASASGMVIGAAIKLVPNIKSNIIGKPVWILLLAVTFISVGLFKMSMIKVLPLVGIPAFFWALYRIVQKANKELKK